MKEPAIAQITITKWRVAVFQDSPYNWNSSGWFPAPLLEDGRRNYVGRCLIVKIPNQFFNSLVHYRNLQISPKWKWERIIQLAKRFRSIPSGLQCTGSPTCSPVPCPLQTGSSGAFWFSQVLSIPFFWNSEKLCNANGNVAWFCVTRPELAYGWKGLDWIVWP